MLRTSLLLMLVFSGCTSAAVPGAGDTLDQADKAREAAVSGALAAATQAMESFQAETGSYPASTQQLSSAGFSSSPEVTVTIVSADAAGYCLEASHTQLEGTYHSTQDDPVMASGPCGG